ncbi:hypothetical protein P7C70_g6091, partial [Phenoliferia sp. Uapishka_3]
MNKNRTSRAQRKEKGGAPLPPAATSTMATLLSLPNELILKIKKYAILSYTNALPHRTSQGYPLGVGENSTALALCLTSVLIKNLVQPLMYLHIIVDDELSGRLLVKSDAFKRYRTEFLRVEIKREHSKMVRRLVKLAGKAGLKTLEIESERAEFDGTILELAGSGELAASLPRAEPIYTFANPSLNLPS